MPRTILHPVVVRTERVSPHVVRVVVGGEALRAFSAGEFTDHYVKLQLPAPGASYSAPFDVEEVKARHPRDAWPRTRTYTVRAWDAEALELTIDFVVHGSEGVAGPWAQSARPGDVLQLLGPGGAYAPDPDADWHLMVGDLSVVPAIAASLPRVRAGRVVHVVADVAPADRPTLTSPGDLRVTWVEGAAELLDAVRALDAPPGRVCAFVHGEASSVRDVRRHLVAERGVDPAGLSASGYWKRARTEEGWREDKRAWQEQVARDDAVATAASS